MNFIHKVLTNVAQEFMQIRVVVVDVAGIWCMVVVLLKNGEGDTAVDAQAVDGHKALVTRLLLNDGELTIAKVLWTDAYHVRVSLTEVAAKHEHARTRSNVSILLRRSFSTFFERKLYAASLPILK